MVFGTGRVEWTSASSISHRNRFLNLSHLPHLLLTSLKHQLCSEDIGFKHNIFNHSQVFPHCLTPVGGTEADFGGQFSCVNVRSSFRIHCDVLPIILTELTHSDWNWDPKYSCGHKYHRCLELGELSHSSMIRLDVIVYMWSHYPAQI